MGLFGGGMQLLELPDPLGKKPSMWVNVDHLVSVMPIYRNTGTAITAEAEVKLEGTPLHRVQLRGDNQDRCWHGGQAIERMTVRYRLGLRDY